MRSNDIHVGKYYHNRLSPNYYAKALKILKPHEGKNTNNFIIVECKLTANKNDDFGLIKYFRPRDLIKEVTP